MAKRRANGEGSLRKRKDGRWEGRYTAGTDPVTGKAIIKNVLGKTQAEVKEKLKKAIAESENLDIKRSGMYTVGEWMELWYEVYAKPRIRESTAVYYKMFIDTHIRPKLGEIKLNQLQTMDIQRLYNELRENGRIRKEIKDKQPGLSVSYIRGMHNMLKVCLSSAVEERLILRNPAEGCKLPKAEKKEMKVLTQEQLGSYLAAADKRGLLPMFFLELTTGLRKGELVPLLWSDVDTNNMTISISKQAYRTKGALTVQPPKTDNSMRKISLSEETMELLKQEHDKHPDNPYLFPSPVTGGMYHPDSVVKLHQKILKDAGLEHIRFHDLRHTFATLALQNGIDVKTVSSMLGHSSAGFTLATYTHATNKVQEQAAAKMGNLLKQAL